MVIRLAKMPKSTAPNYTNLWPPRTGQERPTLYPPFDSHAKTGEVKILIDLRADAGSRRKFECIRKHDL